MEHEDYEEYESKRWNDYIREEHQRWEDYILADWDNGEYSEREDKESNITVYYYNDN